MIANCLTRGFGAALAAAGVAGIWLSYPVAAWAQELFVTKQQNILVYGRAASGDAYPYRTLGALTLNQGFAALAVDTVNNELVALVETGPNQAASEVRVYSRTADGAAAPIRGLSIGLGGLLSVAVDTLHDELYITHQHTHIPGTDPQVIVYSRTASGFDAPIRTLIGVDTGLNLPGAIAVDSIHDELVVLNFTGTVTVYDRTANGDTTPIRTLVTPTASGAPPHGMNLDLVNDELFLMYDDGTVFVFSRTASGTALPIRTLNLPAVSGPTGITVDAVNNELFVTCFNGPMPPSIAVFNRTATGSGVPIRVLTGASRTGMVLPNFPASPAVTTSPPPHIGSTTVGLFRPPGSAFYLWNSNTAGGLPDVGVTLGAPTDLPVVGDFNGDGITTTGVFRPGLTTNTFLLRNTVTVSGIADLRIALGAPGDLPLVGDWNGDGVSTVGLFRPSTNTFYLWNYLVGGAAPDLAISAGAPGDIPLAGDWDGNGTTTIGLYRPSTNTFYLWNSNTAGGLPDASVTLGMSGDIPVVGDWDGNGTTTVGLYRPSNKTFYLWNNPTTGSLPDLIVSVGDAGDIPIVGNWDGL